MKDLFSIMDANDVAGGVRWTVRLSVVSFSPHADQYVVETDDADRLRRTGPMLHAQAVSVADDHNRRVEAHKTRRNGQ